MYELKLKDSVAKFHDTIETLPMLQMHLFNMHVMQDSGMGSDFAAFDDRIGMLTQYVAANKPKEALQELHNLRFGVYFMFEQISLKTISVACLLHSIDNELIEIATDSDLQKAASKLETLGITFEQVGEVLAELRKKWITS
jgi:hypothetical protein